MSEFPVQSYAPKHGEVSLLWHSYPALLEVVCLSLIPQPWSTLEKIYQPTTLWQAHSFKTGQNKFYNAGPLLSIVFGWISATLATTCICFPSVDICVEHSTSDFVSKVSQAQFIQSYIKMAWNEDDETCHSSEQWVSSFPLPPDITDIHYILVPLLVSQEWP